MNYMSQVARMLGVEMEEEFDVRYTENGKMSKDRYRFSCKYGLGHSTKEFPWWETDEDCLAMLLLGEAEIVRKPWKPKMNDWFYFCDRGGQGVSVYNDNWGGSVTDIMMYRLGNCYRTEEGAEKDKDRWQAFFDSDEPILWEKK